MTGLSDSGTGLSMTGATSSVVIGAALTGGAPPQILANIANSLVGLTSAPVGTLPLSGSGYLVTTTLTQPGQCTVTAGGTNNAGIGYRYVSVAWGAGNTQVSPTMTNPFSGNNPLSASNFNIVTPASVVGAIRHDVWRTAGLGSRTVYVGSCANGGTVNDIGSVSDSVNPSPGMPNADNGSAGTVLSGGMVAVTSPNYGVGTGNTQTGVMQIGSTTFDPPIPAAVPGVLGFNLILTGAIQGGSPVGGYNTILMHDIGASSSLVGRVSNGTIQNPTFVSGGAFVIAAENWVTGTGFQTSSMIEMGGINTNGTGFGNLGGRIQLQVPSGELIGVNSGMRGTIVTGSDLDALYPVAYNMVNNLRTNGTGDIWFLTGYAHANDSPAVPLGGATPTFSGAYAGFTGVSQSSVSASWAGNLATYTLTTAHGLGVGMPVSAAGFTPAGYNGSGTTQAGTTGTVVIIQMPTNPGPATVQGTMNYPSTTFSFGGIGGAGGGAVPPVTLTGASISTSAPFQYMGTTAGTDTITVSPTPAITAYNKGTVYFWQAGGTNATTTPTLNISGLGAKTIVKRAATALAAGDILSAMVCLTVYDGTNMELLNPVVN